MCESKKQHNTERITSQTLNQICLPGARYPVVPATLLVQLDASRLSILDKPTSDTQALNSVSIKPLLLVISRWTIGVEQSWCK